MAAEAEALRIGEFARRVGVSPELLRAREARHGLLQPIRSDGGFRLLAGAGSSVDLCRRLRFQRLDGDLVAAADAVARGN